MPTKLKSTQLEIGTGPNNVVALDGTSRLPAVDGSQLLNLPSGGVNNPMTVDLDTGGFNFITPDVSVGAGNTIGLYAGNTTNAAATIPGSISIYAGNSVAGSNTNGMSSGEIFIRAGYMQYTGTGTNLSGGGISLYGGYGYGTSNGGLVSIEGGGSSGAGNGGGIALAGGITTSGNGGYAHLLAGRSTYGIGGSIDILAGNSTSGTPGSILIAGGDQSANTNPGGNVTIRPGNGSVAGSVTIEGPILANTNAQLKLHSGVNNFDVTLSTGTLTGNTNFQFPLTNGTTGNVLQTDGSGITSWGALADLGEFVFANLPAAATYANSYALVTNATTPTAGRVIVRSDGTNWKFIAAEGATVT